MSFGQILRRWGLPVLLAIVALGAWQAADRADFDPVDPDAVTYDRDLATPMFSSRRLPRTLRAPVSDDLISDQIDRIAAVLDEEPACLAVSNGERMLGTTIEPAGGLVPASNQKLVTTWAALEILGPEFTFRTRLASPASAADGVLDGDLHLIGDGDPFLYTEEWLTQYKVTDDRHHTRLESLADAVVAAGITTITGSVIGDETRYDDVRAGPWDPRLIDQKQSGPLSALSVNEGFVDWPEEYVASRLRSATRNPPLHAASVFDQLLQQRGVSIGGAPAAGPTPTEVVEITSIRSPTLADLTTHINSYSSNFGAELLLKRLGVVRGGAGSTAAGANAVAELIVERDLPATDIIVNDGSGLAESNRLTCSLLVDLLAGQGPETALGRSLAIGGERGSLKDRFAEGPAASMVLAKTGTLQSVRSLSGYVLSGSTDTEPGRYVSFAQILNDDDVVDAETMTAIQEPLVEALVTYPTGPSIEELSPREPTRP